MQAPRTHTDCTVTALVLVCCAAVASAFFVRSFYKKMLGRRITLDDLQSIVSCMDI